MRAIVTFLAIVAVYLLTAGRYTYAPPDGGSDGYLYASNIDYLSACVATKSVDTTGVTASIGDRLGSGLFTVYQTFLRFYIDIAPTETIISGYLQLYCTYKGGDDFLFLYLNKNAADWYPLDTSDWLPAVTGVTVWASSQITANATFTSNAVWQYCTPGEIAALSLDTENLCMPLKPPSGNRYIRIGTRENSDSAKRPLLVLNTLSGKRYTFGPMASHEPRGNPLVKVSEE